MSEPATVFIGASFSGAAAEAAHINVVPGRQPGPAGPAWATALAVTGDPYRRAR